VVAKDPAQHLRHHERPEAVAYVFQHLLGEERAEERSTLGFARGAEPPSLAGERDQILGVTLLATDPSETVVVDAAVEEGVSGRATRARIVPSCTCWPASTGTSWSTPAMPGRTESDAIWPWRSPWLARLAASCADAGARLDQPLALDRRPLLQLVGVESPPRLVDESPEARSA
jgi:hypothetical protein